MAATVALTAEYARECFDYDPETGKVTWRRRPREHFKTKRSYSTWNSRFAGQEVNSVHSAGYIRVSVNTTYYLLHRIIWLMTKCEWPTDEIDHINHDRNDNRLENLREVTRLINSRNCSKKVNNTSGITGVSWCKPRKKWKAAIKVNGCKYEIGFFSNIQDAANTVASAYRTNDFHANHGT
jgi:hypothetical protein